MDVDIPSQVDLSTIEIEEAVEIIGTLRKATTDLLRALEQKDRDIKVIKEHAVSEGGSRAYDS